MLKIMPTFHDPGTTKACSVTRIAGIIQKSALWVLCRYRHKTHWTGAAHRLDRLETADKRSASYHFEELVAEMTACFLCCDLQITAQLREESAAYLANWLAVMQKDKRMIFRAASKAQAAADYLHTLQGTDTAA